MTSHRTLSPCNISESTSTNTVSVTWTNVYCFHRGQWQYYLDSMYTITCCYVRGISACSKKMFWFWAPNFTGISKKDCSLNQWNPVPTAAVLPTEVASTYQEWYDYLTKQRTTWIFNPPPPPHSSHIAGVWMKMIGTTRRILDSILLEYVSCSSTHDVLTTLAESCSIMNSRPLVPESSVHDDPFILTPLTFLTRSPRHLMLPTSVLLSTRKTSPQAIEESLTFCCSLLEALKSRISQRLATWPKMEFASKNVSTGDVVLIRDKKLCRNS